MSAVLLAVSVLLHAVTRYCTTHSVLTHTVLNHCGQLRACMHLFVLRALLSFEYILTSFQAGVERDPKII
jgi:hypothetical protein